MISKDNIKMSVEEIRLYHRMIHFYRWKPVYAIRDIQGLKLPPHERIAHRMIAHSTATHFILSFGRAMAKTFTCATAANRFVTVNTLLKVAMIGGGGFRQGKLIIGEQENIIEGQAAGQNNSINFLRRMIDRKLSQSPIKKDTDVWSIPWLTNCDSYTVPVGDGSKIRGLRSQVFILDEAKEMPKAIREKVLRPMSFVKRNPVSKEDDFANLYIYSGTVEYSGDDFTQEINMYKNKMEAGDKDYHVIKFTYVDAFDKVGNPEEADEHSIYFDEHLKHWGDIPYAVDLKAIEKPLTETTTDIESWKAEVLCEPIEVEGSFFSLPLIKSVSHDFILLTDEQAMKLGEKIGQTPREFLDVQYKCEDPVIISLDPGREFDDAGLVVIRLGMFADKKNKWSYLTQTGYSDYANVIWAERFHRTPSRDLARALYDTMERYPNALAVAMDKKGGGSAVRDDLYFLGLDLGHTILYDPSDNQEGGIANLVEPGTGNPRLRLINATDQLNTETALKLRGAMQKQLLLFAKDMSYYEQSYEKINAYKTIKLLLRQLTWILTKPTSNWLKFYTRRPDRQKKDLFSALLYAWVIVETLLKDSTDDFSDEPCAMYVY